MLSNDAVLQMCLLEMTSVSKAKIRKDMQAYLVYLFNEYQIAKFRDTSRTRREIKTRFPVSIG